MFIMQILMIIFIVSFIVDYSGIINTLSEFIFKRIHKGMKYNGWMIPLFSCSLCVTFWILLAFCLIGHGLVFSIFISCLGGWSVKFITMLQHKIGDVISGWINKI